MLSWHVSQPHGDATVASLVDGNRHAQTEQSISKQRDEYIVTIENNFSFFENERPAIHQMALRTFRPQIVDSWTLVFKEREVVLYSYYVFVTLLRDRLTCCHGKLQFYCVLTVGNFAAAR